MPRRARCARIQLCLRTCSCVCVCAHMPAYFPKCMSVFVHTGLGGEWDEQPAQDLRKSIKLQWKCLNDEAMPTQAHDDVCNKWSSCLKMATDSNGVPRFDTILAILKGSGADKAPSLEQFKSIQLLQEHQPPCRDPFMYAHTRTHVLAHTHAFNSSANTPAGTRAHAWDTSSNSSRNTSA